MGRTYPEPIDLDAVCRHTGFDGARVRRAVWELVDHGLVEVHGSPSWVGLPWSVPRLTEAGMAAAFGLASVEDDARGAIGSLEAATPHTGLPPMPLHGERLDASILMCRA